MKVMVCRVKCTGKSRLAIPRLCSIFSPGSLAIGNEELGLFWVGYQLKDTVFSSRDGSMVCEKSQQESSFIPIG